MSLFSFFDRAKAIWNTVAAVWPAVDAFVQQVEAAFPAGTAGATKLAQVKAFLEAGWSKIEGVETSIEEAWPVLSAAIGTLVTLYNTIGAFVHSSKPAAS